MTENIDAIILGAGITGLSCAYFLKNAGLNLRVLESEAACGGRIKTLSEANYLLEAGPNTLQSKDSELWDLVCELGLESRVEFAPENSRRRWIVRDGKLALLPTGPAQIFTTKALSWRGLLRAALEPFHLSRPHPDESVATFVRQHLGSEVCDYLLNPFVRGIYAGDPEQLSIRAAFPKLFEAASRTGSIVRGLIGARRKARNVARASKKAASIYTFSGGIGDLIAALREKLSGCIETGAEALRLSVDSDGFYRVECSHGAKVLKSRRIIFTVPAEIAAKLITPLDSRLAESFEKLNYPALAVVYTAYKRAQVQHALDGFGFLAPAKEKRFVLGTLFSSSLARGRAPADEVLLTSMVAGSSEPEKFLIGDPGLIDNVQRDLRELLGIAGKPVFSKVTRWERSIPQYSLQQLELCDRIAAFERSYPGISFVGNYRNGVSVGACVKGAKELSGAIVANSQLTRDQDRILNEVQNG